MKKSEGNKKIIAKNKKASFEYNLEEKYECGIELKGTEVKSIRANKVSIGEAFCKIKDEEIFIHGMNIAPYENKGYVDHDPLRKRKLLLHKREILKLKVKLLIRGYTLIPTLMYLKRGWVKLDIALAKGRDKADKRQKLKQKSDNREIRRYY